MLRQRLTVVAVAALITMLGSLLYAAPRTWSSRDGKFSVEAEAIDYRPGWINLKKADGKEIAVPLSGLSEDDQAYVEELIEGCRTWTKRGGGDDIFATFVQHKDGWIQLRKIDGQKIAVQLSHLSREDRDWVERELKRKPTTDEPGQDRGKGAPPGGEAIGAIGPQTLAMEPLRIDPPKPGKRLSRDAYLLLMTTPTVFSMEPQKPGSHDEQFARLVRKQPSYEAPLPLRGTIRLGTQEFALVLDAVGRKATGYNLLYFDFNANGDLTDDEPIEARDVSATRLISQSQFPRVDLTVNVDGIESEYSFIVTACFDNSPKPLGSEKATISASLYSALVREGHIADGRKRHRLVLIDRNCNGRFDDRVTLQRMGGRISQEEGDLLLIDPNPKDLLSGDATMGEDRHYVSRTVCIGERFYRLEVPPTGSELKLEPTELALGHVTNSSPAYRAVVYSDDYGVLMIGGMRGSKVPLPEGTWKVATYTIDATAMTGGRRTAVTATFENEAEGVTVSKDETVELPFGQPFRAQVYAHRASGNKIYLSLSIVGVGGERCTSFYVNGRRPPEPRFIISSPDGQVVHRGSFEYG